MPDGLGTLGNTPCAWKGSASDIMLNNYMLNQLGGKHCPSGRACSHDGELPRDLEENGPIRHRSSSHGLGRRLGWCTWMKSCTARRMAFRFRTCISFSFFSAKKRNSARNWSASCTSGSASPCSSWALDPSDLEISFRVCMKCRGRGNTTVAADTTR